jgi:Transposase DNA-binding/Transposase Tn5 dimerisation domain
MWAGVMDYLADVDEWARLNFGGADLGDPRRTRRLVFSAARIATHPEKSFPQLFDWDGLRGFYRMCDSPEAAADSIQAPHRELTRAALARLGVALVLHDTTTLDFTSHAALEGAGPIGDGDGRGFLQHNSLAFSPDGRLLGLIHQRLFVRQPAPPNESPAARKSREGRESAVWVENITAVGRPPEGSLWVDVGDRGADDYEAMDASLRAGHGFLFRACQDRKVFITAGHDEEVYLMQYARGLPAAGYDVVEIPGRGGRPPRAARVALAAAALWVPAPWGTPKRKTRPVLALWVIRVWEVDPPADVKEPLEWVLLTSVPTTTLEQIKERRDWYRCRWGAEVFHDVEKNGCCEEDRRFETAERMQACLAVLSVVAVRVYQLRLALKEAPLAAAEEVATAEEVEVIRSMHKGKRQKALTVKDFVFAVAKLGGFLGRKGDGEPGVRSLWRGHQRLQDMVAGFRLQRRRTHKPSG